MIWILIVNLLRRRVLFYEYVKMFISSCDKGKRDKSATGIFFPLVNRLAYNLAFGWGGAHANNPVYDHVTVC